MKTAECPIQKQRGTFKLPERSSPRSIRRHSPKVRKAASGLERNGTHALSTKQRATNRQLSSLKIYTYIDTHTPMNRTVAMKWLMFDRFTRRSAKVGIG